MSRRLCKALAALSFTLWVTGAAGADTACRQALALGLDVSGSVDEGEYQLQLRGLAAALVSDDVRASLMRLPDAPVRILVFEWSGQDYQRVLIEWTDITSPSRLEAVSEKLQSTTRRTAPPTTALGQAIQVGAGFLNQQPDCWKRTLDISGDGKNNTGPEPHHVNSPEKIGDIVINALIIGVDATSRLSHAELSIAELTEVAIGFDDYERAMSRKLLRELEFLSMSQLDQ